MSEANGSDGSEAARGLMRPIRRGDALNLWALSPEMAVDFPGVPEPAQDPVGYRFVNGFVDAGHLPCRKAFLATMLGRPIAPDTSWPVAAFYAPGSNRRVEFTQFRYTPTHLRRWCRASLITPAADAAPFRIATCGGVRIWVNGVEAARFEPFTRNAEQASDIVLPLAPGVNDVLVHTEDLAERDTNWFFELIYLGDLPLTLALAARVDAGALAAAIELAAGVRPASDVFAGEPLELVFDRPTLFDLPISFSIGSHGHDRVTVFAGEGRVEAGRTRLVAAPAGAVPDGYRPVHLSFRVGDVTLERHIDAAFLESLIPAPAPADHAARKREALEYLASAGEIRIGRALAMLETGRIDEAVLRRILEATLAEIERREDCSDFVMVPLLWVLGAHARALPGDLLARARRAVLAWRYWVDEPGNDVMWFWSENHALCFHVAQYLAGRLFPAEIFTASGRTGAEQATLAKARLARWLDAVEADGLVEWNSVAYYPIDFIGLFALHHWAEAPLKGRATALLDQLFLMIGLHTLAGVPAGSMGRAYDKELRAGPLTELAPFCRVAFGEGWLNPGVAALPLYCASDYAPPVEAVRAARWAGPGAIGARYRQGLERAHLALHKTPASMLSTVVDHHPGRRGYQQHVIDIRLAGHPMARLWVNHPGEDDPWGHQRPSYWAGNGVLPRAAQWGDTALLLYDLGEDPRLAFTHAFAARDALDELQLSGRWLFARSGDGYAALWAGQGLEAIERGAAAGREFRSYGRRTAWLVRISNGAGAAGFRRFIAAMQAVQTTFDAERLTLEARIPGAPALRFDWRDGLAVDGRAATFPTLSVQPEISWQA